MQAGGDVSRKIVLSKCRLPSYPVATIQMVKVCMFGEWEGKSLDHWVKPQCNVIWIDPAWLWRENLHNWNWLFIIGMATYNHLLFGFKEFESFSKKILIWSNTLDLIAFRKSISINVVHKFYVGPPHSIYSKSGSHNSQGVWAQMVAISYCIGHLKFEWTLLLEKLTQCSNRLSLFSMMLPWKHSLYRV